MKSVFAVCVTAKEINEEHQTFSLLMERSTVSIRHVSNHYISPQASRYFDRVSQADTRHMLSDWAFVQKNTAGRYEQHEDDVKKHYQSPQSRVPTYLCRFLSYNRIPKKFPSLYLQTGIATLLIGSIPKNQTIKAS